jgi:2-aminoadipate transaminase
MAEHEVINFTRGVPADESYPVEEIAEAAAAVLRADGVAALRYGSSLGYGPLRAWLAEWYGVDVAQVLVANGSLQIVEFMAMAWLEPGDVVLTEVPTYDRTITALRRHGVRVVGVPVEPDGPNIELLERALTRHRAKLFYTIPDFQNPSGATCSGPKRARVAALAADHDVLLVEDAPYRLLRYRGAELPTLQSIAPHHTVHMSSFTKLLAPGVRMGFAIASPDRIAALARAAEETYIAPTHVAHAIAYEWCRRGLLPPQVERLKALYAPRLEACLAALDRHMPAADATRPDGGFFLSITLPNGVSNADVRRRAADVGLNLADGAAFFPEGGGERFLRLPYCGLTPAQIEEGVRRLAAVVDAVGRG